MISIDLAGKTAFVSGSTQGIGLATAKRLAEAGASVAVNGRSGERVELKPLIAIILLYMGVKPFI